jgi:hypothetical protein
MSRRKTSYKKSKKRTSGLGYVRRSGNSVIVLEKGHSSDSTLKWKVIGWTLGVIGLGTAGYFGYRYYKKTLQGKVEEKSLSIGNPENYAMHLKKAFDNDGWPGTNNDEVFKTFEEIPSYAGFLATKKAYSKLTGNILEHDLDDELSLRELRKIEEILQKKSDAPSSGISLSPPKS